MGIYMLNGRYNLNSSRRQENASYPMVGVYWKELDSFLFLLGRISSSLWLDSAAYYVQYWLYKGNNYHDIFNTVGISYHLFTE